MFCFMFVHWVPLLCGWPSIGQIMPYFNCFLNICYDSWVVLSLGYFVNNLDQYFSSELHPRCVSCSGCCLFMDVLTQTCALVAHRWTQCDFWWWMNGFTPIVLRYNCIQNVERTKWVKTYAKNYSVFLKSDQTIPHLVNHQQRYLQ